MPRLSRYRLAGQPLHVIQRGNNRSRIFRSTADYAHFSEWLLAASRKHSCDVHAYVLMTNHVHMLITPATPAGISNVMQSVGRRYVRYFNSAQQRTGTLWEGRYRATPIDSDRYLLTCYRYVELNPVRAGLVKEPGDYRWSSFRANAFGEPNPLVSQHKLYLALGADAESRRAAYRQLFITALDENTLSHIREASNKSWALGDEQFRLKITEMTQRRAFSRGHGGDRRSVSRSLTP